jgi:integrase
MSKLECETAISSLEVSKPTLETCFQPSKAIEPCADAFLTCLEERRYSVSPYHNFSFIFRNFFLFLEVNHMAFSAHSVQLWLDHIPKTTSWGLKRQLIIWFAQYMETGSAERTSNFVWKPLLIDSLPEWSRKIIVDYLVLRKKEGWEPSTLMMIRSSCVRFFRFVDSKGVFTPDAITPSLVKEFHDTDFHVTPEARNAYAVRVRKLLQYMADEVLVPQNLHLAISTQCASRHEIVTIMDAEMIDAVYRFRENATDPYDLRHIAIVMLGLRMGIRASDIVNLKICDFDWKRRAVSFVQKKTNKAITLAFPTDAGNSVYKYIMHGRPVSGTSGVGYVFIRHTAPYSGLSQRVCGYSLDRILSASDLKLPRGQGFHITRRTFATRLLIARTKVDSIADALGHASRMTVDDYLAHDEEGMMLCPLPFTIGGTQ